MPRWPASGRRLGTRVGEADKVAVFAVEVHCDGYKEECYAGNVDLGWR